MPRVHARSAERERAERTGEEEERGDRKGSIEKSHNYYFK